MINVRKALTTNIKIKIDAKIKYQIKGHSKIYTGTIGSIYDDGTYQIWRNGDTPPAGSNYDIIIIEVTQ